MTSIAAAFIDTPRFTRPLTPRREEVEAKQIKLARLLTDADCEAVLLSEPANVRWFASGAIEHGGCFTEESPVLYVNPLQRWAICGSVDTQRIFDEELNGLGFQVKEWPLNTRREPFLVELSQGRKVASDRPFHDFPVVGRFLDDERRCLSHFEQEKLRELGEYLVHAVEATGRNVQVGDSEEEVAGHLAHRLLKHGLDAVALSIAVEDRARAYRRPGFTKARVETRCQIQATASKSGLFATACRTVIFGRPEEFIKKEYDTATRIGAGWLATLKAEEWPRSMFETAQAALQNTPFEHELRLAPLGWLTGRKPVEEFLAPNSPERFHSGNVVVWQARIGGVAVCDTCVVRENGVVSMTPVEDWPICRYVIQGTRFDLPEVLIRSSP